MKTGGPWNFRGLRPRAREAALDAARQSGMSVGEWLNSVVEGDDDDEVDGQPPRPHDHKSVEFGAPPRRPAGLDHDADGNDRDEPRRDPQDEDRREHRPRREPIGLGAPHRRHGGPFHNPHGSERNEPRRDRPEENRPEPSPRGEAAEFGAPHRRHGGPYRDREIHYAHPDKRGVASDKPGEAPNKPGEAPNKLGDAPDKPGGDEFDQVNERLDKLSQQLEQHRDARESAQRRDQFNQVNDRIDKLSQQLERLALAEVARQQAPAAANTPSEPHEPPLKAAEAPAEPAGAVLRETAVAPKPPEAAAPPKPHEPPLHNPPPPPPVRIEAVRQEAPAVVTTSNEPQQPLLRAVAPPRRRQAPEPALSIDDAVAEITARQRALDGEQSVADGAPAAPPAFEFAQTVDFSALQSQLREITTRIEALKPSSDVGSAITALRGDLADIGRQLNEALPRRAVESLESEIKALSERIDHSRQAGVDPNALAGLERGLAEVREALHGLTPAENLAGFNEAVGALAQKVDMILARDDPATLQQLEAAIGGLRGVVSHVASSDTLAQVAEDVHALAALIDGLANNVPAGHAISALEQRIDALVNGIANNAPADHAISALEQRIEMLVDGIANNAPTGHAISALEQRIDTLAAALHASSEASQAVPRDLEKLLAGLIDKLEWVQLTHTDHAALAHLEDRIAMLVKRFDASEARLNQFDAVERGLADLLVHVEQLRGYDADAARTARLAPAPASAHAVGYDVAEPQQSNRHREDALEARQDPGEHVDHLAAIESHLYDSAPPYAAMPETQAFDEATLEPQITPDPISPAAARAEPMPIEAAAAIVPLAPPPLPAAAAPAARAPIDPSLPPHHPLEPGSAGGRSRPSASAAERVAASEAAIASTKPPVIADSGRPNFIAAARRAAQAAAWEPPGAKAKAEPSAADQKAGPSKLSQRLRKLVLVGSALLIAVGCLRIGIRLYQDNRAIGVPVPAQSERAAPAAPAPAPIAKQVAPESAPAAAAPPVPLPDPDGAATRQPEPQAPAKAAKPKHGSQLQDDERPAVAAVTKTDGGQPTANALPLWATPDITGTLPRAVSGDQPASADADDKLPVAIGDPALRQAALGGDPAAAYEVAARFAEGRGVPQNQVAAAHWLERAAEQGLVPAQFRLGGLYEKGIGVKKDLIRARELYLAAAEKGNGKAMHNLAVLYAEGIDGGPDYKDAAEWFGKAANHGLRDSQYNLGILYARGIGLSQNYAESYKWFALAAAQGDHDAATKRDDVASHLDAQALAAARLAVQNFKPTPQPDDAINVRTAAAWQPSAKPQAQAKAK
jgi:localization factor PodJL